MIWYQEHSDTFAKKLRQERNQSSGKSTVCPLNWDTPQNLMLYEAAILNEMRECPI